MLDREQQLRARLESLKAAGIDWLPRPEPVSIPWTNGDADKHPAVDATASRRQELQLLAERIAG
ncbi:MAG: hypothetical protein ACRCZF_25895, partial [Gemmataceae bacterium]